MPDTNQQVLYTIVAIIITLLFLGILFLVMLLYYQNRKRKFHQEKQLLEAAFTQQLLQSQLEIQEQTFTTISQEIHDNVGQSLSLAKMQLHLLERGNILDKPLLAETGNSISKAITDLRDIAKSLNTERIKKISLPQLISQELHRLNDSGLLHTHMQIQGNEQPIQDQKKLIVFRIVQEALQNVIKHSGADNLTIVCRYSDQFLQIRVTDNGRGFDKNNNAKQDGLGLLNMVHRTVLIGGEAKIESAPAKGTVVTITTPYL